MPYANTSNIRLDQPFKIKQDAQNFLIQFIQAHRNDLLNRVGATNEQLQSSSLVKGGKIKRVETKFTALYEQMIIPGLRTGLENSLKKLVTNYLKNKNKVVSQVGMSTIVTGILQSAEKNEPTGEYAAIIKKLLGSKD